MSEHPTDAVRELSELQRRLLPLFGLDDVAFSDFRSHQTMFMVAGTPRALQRVLSEVTGADAWSALDGVGWSYTNEPENFLIHLSRAGPGATMVMASVLDLHRAYLREVSAGA